MTNQVTGAHITGVKSAKFISLVNSPANQRAFSVIRADGGVILRTRRNDKNSSIHMVTFPADGYDETKAKEYIAGLGLGAHTVSLEEGALVAKRSDLQTIAKDDLLPVKVTEDGVTLWVERMANATAGDKTETQTDPVKDKIAMTAIRFDKDLFAEKQQVTEWLSQNSVDFDENAIQNSDSGYVLRQSPAVDEVREIEVSQGVVMELQRSDILILPESMVAVVSEAAYGNWGWGQLDFSAFLADRLFCDGLEDAQYALNRVINQICYSSNLPLDLRKELIVRSLSQYADFINGMIDALPKQLMISIAQQRSDKSQGGNMSKDKNQGAENSTPPANNADAGAATQVLTREDVAQIVRSVLAEKPAAESAESVVPATEVVDEKSITRSDLQNMLKDALSPLQTLNERMERLEGTTVLRSDTLDPKTDPKTEGNAKDQTRSDKQTDEDLFKGVFRGAAK